MTLRKPYCFRLDSFSVPFDPNNPESARHALEWDIEHNFRDRVLNEGSSFIRDFGEIRDGTDIYLRARVECAGEHVLDVRLLSMWIFLDSISETVVECHGLELIRVEQMIGRLLKQLRNYETGGKARNVRHGQWKQPILGGGSRYFPKDSVRGRDLLNAVGGVRSRLGSFKP